VAPEMRDFEKTKKVSGPEIMSKKINTFLLINVLLCMKAFHCKTQQFMKATIVLVCVLLSFSCDKSKTEKKQQHTINCGCDADSIVNVCVDSAGWLSFDSASNTYSIHDTIQSSFLNIYRICNPEIPDIISISDSFSTNHSIPVYFSGKVEAKCPDTLISPPDVFHYNITIDSLKKK
jgi:hypothetical protein